MALALRIRYLRREHGGSALGLLAPGGEGNKGLWSHSLFRRDSSCSLLLRPRVSQACESPAPSSCSDPGQEGCALLFPMDKAQTGGSGVNCAYSRDFTDCREPLWLRRQESGSSWHSTREAEETPRPTRARHWEATSGLTST